MGGVRRVRSIAECPDALETVYRDDVLLSDVAEHRGKRSDRPPTLKTVY